MASVKLLVGSVIGYVVGSLFNSILVVVKETWEGVYKWLVDVFGHHWIGHGILVIVVFTIFTLLGAYSSKTTALTEELSKKLILAIVASTIISVLIIAGFFLAHL